jgi:hypothetical protein
MDCSLPLSFIGNPSSDLSKCSGKLKEGIQDVIIKKMYAYIYENIGKINEEITQVS